MNSPANDVERVSLPDCIEDHIGFFFNREIRHPDHAEDFEGEGASSRAESVSTGTGYARTERTCVRTNRPVSTDGS